MRESSDGVLAITPEDMAIGTSECVPALTLSEELAPDLDESLNRLERLAADFGAWVAALAERWNLQTAPSFGATCRPIGGLLDASYAAESEPDATL